MDWKSDFALIAIRYRENNKNTKHDVAYSSIYMPILTACLSTSNSNPRIFSNYRRKLGGEMVTPRYAESATVLVAPPQTNARYSRNYTHTIAPSFSLSPYTPR